MTLSCDENPSTTRCSVVVLWLEWVGCEGVARDNGCWPIYIIDKHQGNHNVISEQKCGLSSLYHMAFAFTFTFREFSRPFYPKRLTISTIRKIFATYEYI